MTDAEKIAELRDEASAAITALSASLPSRIQASDIGRTKFPYKILSFRESLCWRMEELARNALMALDVDHLVVGTMLSRASLECAAACWHVRRLARRVIKEGLQPTSDDLVMRLLLGTRTWEELPQAINVLNMLEQVEKEVPGILGHYGRLSEYAHPNWLGTGFLFSRNLEDERATEFGRRARGDKIGLRFTPGWWGLSLPSGFLNRPTTISPISCLPSSLGAKPIYLFKLDLLHSPA